MSPVSAKNHAHSATSDARTEVGPPAGGTERDLFVVALGASAGGLEALEKFFDNMPAADSRQPDQPPGVAQPGAGPGLAFVVVQHLSPDFKSLMNELLARHTKLAIHRVTDGMVIEPNSIYLIPPKKEMIVSDGKLLLTDKDPAQGLSLPIDTFLRSLAHEYGRNAIAVILSGTGSDGSRGIVAIHDAGGLVIVQDEATANFDGMPRSAMDTGVVDAVLPPREMAAAILDYIHQRPRSDNGADCDGQAIDHAEVHEIFRALHSAYGIDFSYYKPNTVARRVQRRLQINHSADLADYVTRLRHDQHELNALYKDLLIGVTKFFRDEDAFQRLEMEVIPQLLGRINSDDELRIWVAGCATGEEAYSVAILVHEALSARRMPLRAKIFATDVHEASLELASAGIYHEESLAGMSAARLNRYFKRQSSGYQVMPELRKMIVFAPHNVIKDAPFTKLDLICCRNMLIYLQPHAQKKAVSLFHFALKTGGFLFLGPSESAGELTDEFDAVDRHWKIFRKRRDIRLPADFRLPLSPGLARWRATAGVVAPETRGLPEVQLLRAYDVLLDAYVPPSLMVNERRELVHSFAGAGKYLNIPDGRPSQDVLDMVEPDLKLALAGALQRAAKEKQPIVYGSVSLRSLPEEEQLRLSVKPITIQSTGEEFFLISFETQARRPAPEPSETAIDFDMASRERLLELEEELRYTKENLQATIEEMETTNEELQATNEELVASNEELQSTNEELHSVNEELYTVNAEHQRKIVELTELTDDMDNLLRSTEVGTIFLDRALRIRKFTPQIYHAFQILPQDIGRSIEAFSHNILHESLLEDVERVAATETPFEKDVQDRHGKWYLLRILPYRSKGHVDGVVITLVEISGIKRAEAQLRRMSKVFMDGADPIVIEDLDGRIIDLNDEAVSAYGWMRDEMTGQPSSMLVPEECVEQANELRARCRNADHVRNVETLRTNRAGEKIPILLTLSVLQDESGRPVGIASLSKDIRAQKEAERQAREAVVRRDEFLAMLSHELRNPLSAVLNASQLLAHGPATGDHAKLASDVIVRQSRQMARLLDDLLDVSRFTQGKIDIRKQIVDLSSLVQDVVEAIRPELEDRRHALELQIGQEPLFIEGDPSRLLQILENLLTNAVRYTPPQGRIVLSMKRDGNEAVLCVEDNGQGIPPDMLSTIFELFVQGPKSLARTEGGMGIGLSLVRLLVELHGGTVLVESAGKGCGSAFTVRLPLTDKRPQTEKPSDASADRSLNVLVVEDNDDSRLMLERLLKMDGHNVYTAADGKSGYDVICTHKPEVVLMDIGLPVMDGYEVARKVRAELGNHPIRLVALTGYGRSEDHEAVMNAGFDYHLVKPADPRELARVLRKQ
ncbi:MAG TPA: chemotaxis protein CheB [Lacipirellulaceae bacterium]|nr:chemotaxis protein CheB [Lacipirellulaceae bacterium]